MTKTTIAQAEPVGRTGASQFRTSPGGPVTGRPVAGGTQPAADHAVAWKAMKGDRVEVLVDVGGGGVQRFDIAATRAGRRVEVSTVRGHVEVIEVTRTGQPVRSATFMASRVVAVVEHPASDGDGHTTRRGAAPTGSG